MMSDDFMTSSLLYDAPKMTSSVTLARSFSTGIWSNINSR